VLGVIQGEQGLGGWREDVRIGVPLGAANREVLGCVLSPATTSAGVVIPEKSVVRKNE
jgi:hypothetical protein